MKILLYESCKLEEKVSQSLKVWKAWHITLYVLIAVFGILNFTLLQKTKDLVDGNCVFYPVELAFHMTNTNSSGSSKIKFITPATDPNENKMNVNKGVTKREIKSSHIDDVNALGGIDTDFYTGNSTQHLTMQIDRTLFGDGAKCEFAEYLPVLSSIFAVVWITMFMMCPKGGKSHSGLQQPWSILAPAFVFAIAMVAFTGYSFTTTNGGLHAFCAAFYNVTNSTACSSIEPYLEGSSQVSWGFGSRATSTRAASAVLWAGWACAAALLLARCLAAPDFALQRTGVHLVSDPKKKIIPTLKKNPSRTSGRSPRRVQDESPRSEPTLTSQLVTASIEPGAGDSAPTSLNTTPMRNSVGESIEMA